MLLSIGALIAAVVLVLVLHYRSRNTNYPPGPRGLPLFGFFFSMEWVRKERTFMKLAREYGPVFMIKLLGHPTVVLSDPDLIRDALSRTATTLRPRFPALDALFYMDCGLIFSSGELWQHSRRFTLHHLRKLGMGRSRLEAVIQEQVRGFLDEVVAPSEGRPLCIDRSLRVAVANIIWSTVSSEQFNIHDERALSVMNFFDDTGKHVALLTLHAFVPAIHRLPARLTGIDRIVKLFNVPLEQLLRPAIVTHESTIDLDGEPRDYIDCLLQERRRRPDLFTERHLMRSILDLFIAGYDTTTATLLWTFCFLCTHPAVQERMRTEIRREVGESRPTALADRSRLPFTEAVLMESQRLGDIGPFGVEHMASEDFQLAGYTVPRGAHVIALLTAVHQDERLFPEPALFRPERFLDDKGRLKPNRALMPFCVGKRACMGEAMARAELFLFVTNVLQKYRLRFVDGFQHDLSCIEHKTLIREPSPFEVVMDRW